MQAVEHILAMGDQAHVSMVVISGLGRDMAKYGYT
jgi:hypothetical protein